MFLTGKLIIPLLFITYLIIPFPPTHIPFQERGRGHEFRWCLLKFSMSAIQILLEPNSQKFFRFSKCSGEVLGGPDGSLAGADGTQEQKEEDVQEEEEEEEEKTKTKKNE